MHEIDEDRPLPSNTLYDCYECYAKIVLEEMFPNHFSNLIIADRPDLQNEQLSIGVEVTKAMDPNQIKAESLYSQISYNKQKDQSILEKKIKECGAEYCNGVLRGVPGHDNFERIYDALRAKLKKMTNYKHFFAQCLFIFSDILATSSMQEDALKKMIEICKLEGNSFIYVFVLVPGAIYFFDLANGMVIERKICSSMQMRHACNARDMVIQKERSR